MYDFRYDKSFENNTGNELAATISDSLDIKTITQYRYVYVTRFVLRDKQDIMTKINPFFYSLDCARRLLNRFGIRKYWQWDSAVQRQRDRLKLHFVSS